MRILFVIFALHCFALPAHAADHRAVDLRKITVTVAASNRKPASSCVGGKAKFNGADAITVKDYSSCNAEEIDGLKQILPQLIDLMVDSMRDKKVGSIGETTAVAYMAAAKASLALVNALPTAQPAK